MDSQERSNFPVIVQPSYTVGKGRVVVDTPEELGKVVDRVLDLSPISEVTIRPDNSKQ